MTPIKTNGITILLVEVPEDAKNFEIMDDMLLFTSKNSKADFSIIPSGQYQILGKSTELSDEQMKGICEKIHVEEAPSAHNDFAGGFHYGFVDYTNIGDYSGYQGNCNHFVSVNKSYLSMLEANGIVDRNREINPDEYTPKNIFDLRRIKKQYQESQSKVKHYLVLKRI